MALGYQTFAEIEIYELKNRNNRRTKMDHWIYIYTVMQSDHAE